MTIVLAPGEQRQLNVTLTPIPECMVDTDCPDYFRCVDGVCVPPECVIDTDCPDGFRCVNGVCV